MLQFDILEKVSLSYIISINLIYLSIVTRSYAWSVKEIAKFINDLSLENVSRQS